MEDLLEKIKIRKVVLIYISAVIFTFIILQMPSVKNIYLKNKYFGEFILNVLILIWFYIIFSKENISVKSEIIHLIKKVNYKKIVQLYILNLGIYIGIGLCIFIGDKSLIKVPSNIFIIFGITLAPIVEEFIFRGVIMSRLKIRLGIIPAIFISSIIFGIVHFDFNIFGRLFFGILSALLYIQTKNIINCIIFHGLNNGSIFIFPIISQYTNFSINMDSEFKTNVLIFIIFSCFVLSVVLNIIYIKNNLPRKDSKLS
ncbi:type II CAAX endopeptidase family protein [Tissierella praeacuta]|uniref:CPBP family intramembrane glutamic endopeptidase n=1 Tax=Tissierella praeacuta TaxID=43131 RepID=UPI0035170C73